VGKIGCGLILVAILEFTWNDWVNSWRASISIAGFSVSFRTYCLWRAKKNGLHPLHSYCLSIQCLEKPKRVSHSPPVQITVWPSMFLHNLMRVLKIYSAKNIWPALYPSHGPLTPILVFRNRICFFRHQSCSLPGAINLLAPKFFKFF
jgi:hypothetical protein